jgi:hypothetical protein
MRRWLPAAAGLGLLGACNFFGGNIDPPSGFQGWFHVDRPGRATSIAFSSGNFADVWDLACDGVLSGATPWTADGDTVVLTQWSYPPPRFVLDPSTSGALLANPGMYGTAQEQWLPGATCLVCPPGDAGVAVACDAPMVRDGGT